MDEFNIGKKAELLGIGPKCYKFGRDKKLGKNYLIMEYILAAKPPILLRQILEMYMKLPDLYMKWTQQNYTKIGHLVEMKILCFLVQSY